MKLFDIVRIMEKNANSGPFGETDFVFNQNFAIRHVILKSHDDRLVTISQRVGDDWETMCCIVYEKEILDSDGKFKGVDVFMSGDENLMASYTHTAKVYFDIISNNIIFNLAESIYEDYTNEDPTTMEHIKNGNIDFVQPIIIENGGLNTTHYEDETFSDTFTDINEALTYLMDYITDVSCTNDISLIVKTEMAIRNQFYWHELKITKASLFGELCYVFARKHCALPKDCFMNSYIANIRSPEGMSDYINGAIEDIITTCNKVSSNPNIFTIKIKRNLKS